jgi:transposase
MRVLVALEPVEPRKGIDGLAQLSREKLGADPFSGYLFIFRGRRATAIKLLAFDGQGFWVAQKRLSKGRVHWWPTGRLGPFGSHPGNGPTEILMAIPHAARPSSAKRVRMGQQPTARCCTAGTNGYCNDRPDPRLSPFIRGKHNIRSGDYANNAPSGVIGLEGWASGPPRRRHFTLAA